MADFEKLHGEPIIVPETSEVISLESVVAALAEVALEVKEGEEIVLVDKDGAIFRTQQDGAFHLNPKKDYLAMRSTYSIDALQGWEALIFGFASPPKINCGSFASCFSFSFPPSVFLFS